MYSFGYNDLSLVFVTWHLALHYTYYTADTAHKTYGFLFSDQVQLCTQSVIRNDPLDTNGNSWHFRDSKYHSK